MSRKNLLDQVWSLRSDSKLKPVSLNLIVHLITDDESQKCVAALINKLLLNSTSKIEGLELINVCLSHFSPQVICDHGLSWIRCCLNHHEQDQNRDIYENVSKYYKVFTESYRFQKEILSEYLSPTLDSSLLKTADLNVKESALNCLVACLSYYSSSCNTYKQKLKTIF
ncbi:hypothetical protein HHI36_020190 [Cryptolaemus montrouzieri]|uniref:Uncharacterized protein n=1 Tax=Cryptolaemus montrouzieri TaxID=559131 RepID=A0ABD2NA64_9CUCU